MSPGGRPVDQKEKLSYSGEPRETALCVWWVCAVTWSLVSGTWTIFVSNVWSIRQSPADWNIRLLFTPHLMGKETKGAFWLHWVSSLPRTGCSLRLISRRTLDPRPLLTPNRSAGRVLPDYFGSNQWCGTCVSGYGNHSLLINSKESQVAVQFFHYRVPLLPVQLCAVSRMNIVAKSNKILFPTILVWDRNEWTL